MKYLISLNKTKKGVKAVFLDIPNFTIVRDNEKDVIDAAKIALVMFLERNLMLGKDLIYPVVKTDIKTLSNVINSKDLISISIFPDIWLKLLLQDTFNKSVFTKKELAEKVNISINKLDKIFNVKTKTDLILLNKLFRVMGKKITIGVE